MANYVGVSSRDLQTYLQNKSVYNSTVDGIEGTMTQNAVDRLLNSNDSVAPAVLSADYSRKRLAVNQLLFQELGFYNDTIDGLNGPNTEYAIEQYQNHLRGIDRKESSGSNSWPTYSNIQRFYGAPGTNHTTVRLPYTMKLAWDTKTQITRLTINKKCADSFLTVMENVLRAYSLSDIKALRLDMFGGCYNNRKMRGGSKLSTHAYAAALDFDPSHNPLRAGADRATFARPEYDEWWSCWEKQGWVSLGRERNYDWMHVQAVRL